MRERVVGIGAGGHARVLIEILRAADRYELVGLLEADPELKGASVQGVPILGDDTLLPDLREKGVCGFFVGIGSIGDASRRKLIYDRGSAMKLEAINCVHLSAIVSPSAQLGKGVSIMAGAIINPGTKLGDNVIVNTGAVVDHDCWLGDHVHVATGATLSGTVRLGEGVHVGAGAVIRQNITIGDHAIIGAGAAVVGNVAAGAIVVGVPARLLPRRT